jgi:hypothetical protein
VRLRPQPANLDRPVFIIGCGRSGTTILGRLLSMHPDVVYLNEPRQIWGLDAATDIWSATASRGGKLVLTGDDLSPAMASRIRRAFAVEMRLQEGRQLVEKLPVNSFRVGYIAAIFPDARFIHLMRDGMKVAASIAVEAGRGHWFGVNDYKWQQLVEYGRTRGLSGLVPLCTTDFYRGLLEWRLTAETIESVSAALSPAVCTQLRYEDLVARPVETCEALEDWLGVEPSIDMRSFAAHDIGDQRADIEPHGYDTAADAIAGPTLRALGYGRLVTESG